MPIVINNPAKSILVEIIVNPREICGRNFYFSQFKRRIQSPVIAVSVYVGRLSVVDIILAVTIEIVVGCLLPLILVNAVDSMRRVVDDSIEIHSFRGSHISGNNSRALVV